MRHAAILAATLALMIAEPPVARAQVETRGACEPNATGFVVAAFDTETTETGNPVPVGGTGIKFTSTRKGCVLVSFTAEAATAVNEQLIVYALLDGKTCAPQAGAVFALNQPQAATHAMDFVCTNVAAGTHAVAIGFLSTNGGGVTLITRTTTVHFIK